MFILFFFSVNYKDVIFMVNYSKEAEVSSLTIKNFREYLVKTTLIFFSLSVGFGLYNDGLFYFNLLNSLYLTVIIIKYISCHNKIKEAVLSSGDIKKIKKEEFPITLEADAEVTNGTIVKIFDIVRQNGYASINLRTSDK